MVVVRRTVELGDDLIVIIVPALRVVVVRTLEFSGELVVVVVRTVELDPGEVVVVTVVLESVLTFLFKISGVEVRLRRTGATRLRRRVVRLTATRFSVDLGLSICTPGV